MPENYHPGPCPKCGSPARRIIVTRARAVCDLEEDGTIGKVRRVSRASEGLVEYECGGGHRWKEEG